MKLTKLMVLFALVSIAFSCNRVDDVNIKKDYNSKTAIEAISIERNFEFTNSIANKYGPKIPGFGIAYRDFDCVEVEASNSFGQFPNTVTIDFGSACQVNDSLVVSGKIITTFSGFMNHSGDSIVTTYDNFFMNGNQIEGTSKVKNNGKNDLGQREFIKEIVDGNIIFENGETAGFNSFKVSKYFNNDTPFKLKDDQLNITGHFEGTTSDGESFQAIIRNELEAPFSCKCVVKGDIDLTVNSEDTYNINYGDGTCDNIATVTFPDGTQEDITVCK